MASSCATQAHAHFDRDLNALLAQLGQILVEFYPLLLKCHDDGGAAELKVSQLVALLDPGVTLSKFLMYAVLGQNVAE
jgi:hypothetical protein